MKPTALFLALSLLANAYFISQLYRIDITNGSIAVRKDYVVNPGLGTIYEEECPVEVTSNRICAIELVETRPDFTMIKVHYHYVKGEEASTRIVVKANKGSHDNIVGTKSTHHLLEGSHTTLIPFGLYKAGEHTSNNPYVSEYIMVKAQGISADGKRYITPAILEASIKHRKEWHAEGGTVSW